jgi:hypothetical protein
MGDPPIRLREPLGDLGSPGAETSDLETLQGRREGTLLRSREFLLAVLASPPKTTAGDRTSRRVELASELLGYQEVQIVNLLCTPTRDVCDIQAAGATSGPWIYSRAAIKRLMPAADAVLFAWGCKPPTGPARPHHGRQVNWVRMQATEQGLSQWTVGGTPRHPSRWQRYTHRAYPGLDFREALRMALTTTLA